MTYRYLAASLLLLTAWSYALYAQEKPKDLPLEMGMGYPRGLKDADVVAVIAIDAGQIHPPIFHGTVTKPVKGAEKGMEVCFTMHFVGYPAIGKEALFFLFRNSNPPQSSRITSCGPATSFLTVPEWGPVPLPIVKTSEVRPCVSKPCARRPYCPDPPCSNGVRSVRLYFPAGFTELNNAFPAACREYGEDSWVLEDELLAAMRSRLRPQ